MIEIYSGTPGSGKTSHAVKRVSSACFAKMPVVTNMPVKILAPRSRNNPPVILRNEDITPGFLLDFSKDHPTREGGKLLVIDEAQLMFSNREWNAEGRKQWIAFFTQHRKLGYDCILITQNPQMLDKQIRSLAEYEVQHRRIGRYGIVGKLISTVFLNRLFVAVRYWNGGGIQQRLNSECFVLGYYTAHAFDTTSLFGGSYV